jgi:glycine oxidase
VTSFDLTVVGGGVIGTSIAWTAAREGLRVVLLERDRIAAHASRVAAGMLAPFAEGGRTPLPLGEESLSLYPTWVEALREEVGCDVGFRRCGILRVAVEVAQAEALRAAIEAAPYASQRWLDSGEARELEPTLSPGIAGAVWSPDEAQVDPERLTLALAEAARRAGATVVEQEPVRSLEWSDGRVSGVHSGRLGAWAGSPEWSQRLGLSLPIRPVRGQLLHCQGAGLRSGAVVWSPSLYLVPRAEDRVVVGATEEDAGFDCRVTEEAVRELEARAWSLAPGLRGARLNHARAGLRPATPDDLPLVGVLSSNPGLIAALGHFRNGILLAPITARLVIDQLHGKPLPPAARAFDPERFGRQAAGSPKTH